MNALTLILVTILSTFFCACVPDKEELAPIPPIENPDNGGGNPPDNPIQSTNKLKLTIGLSTFSVTLYDNSAVTAFKKLLPITVAMSDMNRNEKYCNLTTSLPVMPNSVGVINSGDLMLFGSSTLVLFYETFSTFYNYTQLGKIDNLSGLKEALGGGDIVVKIEL